jgi:hypothetical protein
MLGAAVGSALASFAGFIGSSASDFWFKLVLDAVMLLLLWRLKPEGARS